MDLNQIKKGFTNFNNKEENQIKIMPKIIKQPKKDIRQKQKENFLQLIGELRILTQKPSAYDNDREKMASMFGEAINLSFTIIADHQEKMKRMTKEYNIIKEENSKLKKALIELARQEKSESELFKEDFNW